MKEKIMQYQTLKIEYGKLHINITINRSENRNTINGQLLSELNMILDSAEADFDISAIVLQGQNGIFCTGMDFEESINSSDDQVNKLSSLYMKTLKRFSLSPLMIICILNGQVLAGGVGFVSASDLVIASSKTNFSLSEIIWGLLPACVLPFLIRRVGFQTSYVMTLTSNTITADEAYKLKLIDILTEEPKDELRKLMMKLRRINRHSLSNAKSYFRKLWILDERIEQLAVEETSKLATDPRVRKNIENYIKHQRYPWSTEDT